MRLTLPLPKSILLSRASFAISASVTCAVLSVAGTAGAGIAPVAFHGGASDQPGDPSTAALIVKLRHPGIITVRGAIKGDQFQASKVESVLRAARPEVSSRSSTRSMSYLLDRQGHRNFLRGFQSTAEFSCSRAQTLLRWPSG